MDKLRASFRDPAGFLYLNEKGELLRQINHAAAKNYDLLIETGLYRHLAAKKMLIKHDIHHSKQNPEAYLTIKPEKIPIISYPFEWSFSQLKDAALLTLNIQKTSIQHGLSLKDASAYNVQFSHGSAIFIDTLSFEKYKEVPWAAYGQFCRHFLAPLALMSYTDVRLSQLFRVHIDGVPLDLASKLLPNKARLNIGVLIHLFAHAKSQTIKSSEHKAQTRKLTKANHLAILDSLERAILRLKQKQQSSEWANYYDETNYSKIATDAKSKLVAKLASQIKPESVLDLGGNTGRYSRIFTGQKINTICADIDPNAVEINYRESRKNTDTHMLPLLIDLTNPGGMLGWSNEERQSIHERLQADMVLALALVHHLAISNNVPLERIAEYLSRFAEHLIIEFVPKTDSQVQKLLSTRKDIFPDYTKSGFETAFETIYNVVEKFAIPDTQRTLYFYRRKKI